MLGSLVENIVNHLDRIDQPGAKGLERGIGFVLANGNAEAADLAAFLQFLNRAAPVLSLRPRIRPHMELLQIDLLAFQIAQALVG